MLSVFNISPGFMQRISVTVGCDDLGAPYVTHMHTHNRRGEHCSPKNRAILRCVGAHCAPLRDNVYQIVKIRCAEVVAPYGNASPSR